MFKLGHSKKASPITSMQVAFARNLLPEFKRTELPPLQIKVTTEQLGEHGESSVNESEYELQKVPSIPQISSNEVREEHRSPGPDK